MAVIWGLDLREMQWGKFKGSYMFNRVYHLRCTKMIVYQIAMILCVCSESVGTAALTGISLLPPRLISQPFPFPSTPYRGSKIFRMLIVFHFADYVDQQDGISHRSAGRAMVHNNDIVGIFSYNIFVGIAVATVFGSGFFFDLFWPERQESPAVKTA
jgi:hypothetical protein